MDSEILNQIIQLKWITLALFVSVFLTILFFVVSIAFRVRATNTEALLMIRDNYLAELALLEVKGDYPALLEKSEDMLQSYPNDVLAHWYNALGNRKAGQLGAALSALGRVKSINSAWSADVVDDLIAEIKSEMGGPRARRDTD